MSLIIIILTGIIALLSGAVITLFFVLYHMKKELRPINRCYFNVYKDIYTGHYYTGPGWNTHAKAVADGSRSEDYITTVKI